MGVDFLLSRKKINFFLLSKLLSGRFFYQIQSSIVRWMRRSYVNRRSVLGCANSGRPTLLLLVLLPLLLLLLLLTPVLVCLLLLLLVVLTPVVLCGSVASGMLCLLNIPKMLMVN